MSQNVKVSHDAYMLLRLLDAAPAGGMDTLDMIKATGWSRDHLQECMEELVEKGLADPTAQANESQCIN